MANASALLAEYGEEAKLIAGGTAVVLMLQQKLIAPRVLISLGAISGYDFIRSEDGSLHVGALVSLHDAAQSAPVNRFSSALAHAFNVVGNIRIRNQATVGGNLAEADYASDPPTMLAALDCRVGVLGGRGERELAWQDFLLGFFTTALAKDELVTEIVVPALPKTARTVYLKYTSRSAEDRPCVGVAAVADLTRGGRVRDLRVAVGAAVETPQRLPEVESDARGRVLNDALVDEVAEAYAHTLDPLEDMRGSAWYRRQMIRVFVRRALVQVRDGAR